MTYCVRCAYFFGAIIRLIRKITDTHYAYNSTNEKVKLRYLQKFLVQVARKVHNYLCEYIHGIQV